MSKLHLERRHQPDETLIAGPAAVTPKIDEDYWEYRVKVSDTQAVVGFPKFGTIGIGFAVEEDWNTNLPYTCETEYIYQHIEENRGDDSITRDVGLEAIRLIQEAAMVDRGATVLKDKADQLQQAAEKSHDGWLGKDFLERFSKRFSDAAFVYEVMQANREDVPNDITDTEQAYLDGQVRGAAQIIDRLTNSNR